jgi:hypothetical protein
MCRTPPVAFNDYKICALSVRENMKILKQNSAYPNQVIDLRGYARMT